MVRMSITRRTPLDLSNSMNSASGRVECPIVKIGGCLFLRRTGTVYVIHMGFSDTREIAWPEDLV